MRTYLFLILFALSGCSGPDSEDKANGTTVPVDSGVLNDTGSTSNSDSGSSPTTDGGVGNNTAASDGGMSTMTPDVSTLPTECVNDCLCESSCSHRCNITCNSECASGTCDFELNAGGYVTCKAGSSCSVSCESGGCEVTCEAGASCELSCGPQAVACFFTECSGTEESCSARRKTCDVPC